MPKTIPLTRGFVAIVDDEDFKELSQFKWAYLKSKRNGYAVRYYTENGKRRAESMHRRLLGFPPNLSDHKNGDGLDNQRQNLRACTKSESNQNRGRFRSKRNSRFKGVFKRTDRKYPYIAMVKKDGHARVKGSFRTQTAAARAYDQLAKELFGEFARLNFPEVEQRAAA